MFRIITGIVITILSVVVIGTGYWGYQENQEKNSILIKAENQYQRAFHDLNFHINALNEEIGKTLAVNSRKQLTPCLANVWRLAYAAQADVGQLPLVLLPFNKTEEFLANIADYSYRISIRDLNKEPLSAGEYKQLQALYKNSQEIKQELSNVQDKVISNNLRWMDVELALSSEDKQTDNTIIDGFKTINKKVEEFSELEWEPGVNNLTKSSTSKPQGLAGQPITADEAKKQAQSFLGLDSSAEIKVFQDGKGQEFKTFSLTVEQDHKIYLDITKAGGHVVWMMINRDIPEKKLSFSQATTKAEEFLKEHKMTAMVPFEYRDFDNSVIISFAYQQDNVLVYSDLVTVKVALDNGQIIGLQSADYVFNHQKRQIPAPEISKEQALSNVNPNLEVKSIRLALIKNFAKEEVLAYEITGNLGESYYRIYLNADNGDEEEIQKVEKQDIA